MGKFISTERVPVSLDTDPTNVIFIKPKMDLYTKRKVMDALMRVEQGANNETDVTLQPFAYTLALMEHNIVGWQGPDFEDEKGNPVPCNAANIRRLDPDDPLVEKVGDEIARRNPLQSPAESEEAKNASTAGGSTSSRDTLRD